MSHPSELSVNELIKDCHVRRQRRSGPGGQHRNKVETAIVITHTPTGIQGAASERRNQAENRKHALFRLRINLALHLRTSRNKQSELWNSGTSNKRISINPQHTEFPAVLAEALDVIVNQGLDMKRAAEILSVSSSQLIKLIKADNLAWQHLNQLRSDAGQHPLK
ncbi:MAG: peptide chain release factor-like protein [Pirellulales bacterium]|nr:peptide chain release factor-like protein [Pirellulales bacterium]